MNMKGNKKKINLTFKVKIYYRIYLFICLHYLTNYNHFNFGRR